MINDVQKCKREYVWDVEEEECIPVNGKRGRLLSEIQTQSTESAYYDSVALSTMKMISGNYFIKKNAKTKFTLKPGDAGFNAQATALMHSDNILSVQDSIHCPVQGTVNYQPYQKTIKFLTDPRKTPITRMLMAHRTGAGKTLEMIIVLTNYYQDYRPKLIIFPNDDVLKNFYEELMAWDNPYRDYVYSKLRNASDVPNNLALSRKLTATHLEIVKDILALKGNPQRAGTDTYMNAPLRAFSYTEIGGRGAEQYSYLVKKPRHLPNDVTWDTCSKIGDRLNIMCNKIILMDEAHNLAKFPYIKVEITRKNLEFLSTSITECKNSSVFLFTATPVVDDPEDAVKIMDVVKGIENKGLSDEGFVSAYYANPSSAYPIVTPPERMLPEIIGVPLSGSPNDPRTSLGGYLHRLYTTNTKDRFKSDLARNVYEHTSVATSFQSREPFYSLVVAQPEIYAPKLKAAADLLLKLPGKSIIMVSRAHGFFTLGHLIENSAHYKVLRGGKVQSLLGDAAMRADFKAHTCTPTGKRPMKSITPKELTNCVKNAFNDVSNDRGEVIQALILNADQFSEGIDFKSVRNIILVDVPKTWGIDLQRIGRAIRHCSHSRLPLEERTVNTFVLVATLPHSAQLKGRDVDLSNTLTIDQINLLAVLQSREEIEKAMCKLRNVAVDRSILLQYTNDHECDAQVIPDFVQPADITVNSFAVGEKECDKHLKRCLKSVRRVKWIGIDRIYKVMQMCTSMDVFCRKKAYKRIGADASKQETPTQPKSVDSDKPTSGNTGIDNCANCSPSIEKTLCLADCNSHNLTGIDLYRCVSRLNTGPCTHK